MKNLKLITLVVIALTTIISCSKDDDETTPTFEELLVENSPWTFNGIELSNVINNGTEEFDIDEFEKNVREANENTLYIFNLGGIGEIQENNEVVNSFKWEIIEGIKLRLTNENNDWESIFSSLNVTDSQLNFILVNMQVANNVNADLKYVFSKKSN